MSETHDENSVALTLCRATNVWPPLTLQSEDSEGNPTKDYREFMDGLLAKFDGLTQNQYNKVPSAVREWAEEAIESINNGNPIGACPGFDNLVDVEDHTPMFPDSDEDTEDEEVEAKSKSKKSRKPRVSRGAKKDGKAKEENRREARPLGTGKTVQIYEQIFADPKISVEQIRKNLTDLGVETQETSTGVVRNFYRGVVKFLSSKGALNKTIEF